MNALLLLRTCSTNVHQLKATPPTSPVVSNYAVVYKWRLEQEHNMKATNGGRGMSDLAVKS